MCEKPLLRAGEQRFQIGQRGGADMLPRSAHGEQALLGKDHVGQHIVGMGRTADEANGGIGVISTERIVRQIAQRGVERLHCPVKCRKVKAVRLGERARVRIDVRHDVLPVDGGGVQSFQQRRERLPADEVRVDHHAGGWHRGECIQLARRPERHGVYILGYGVKQRMHAFVPQKRKAERVIIPLGLGITNHTDGAVFPPPRKRGQRGGQQLERFDRVRAVGRPREKRARPGGVKRTQHQISSNP